MIGQTESRVPFTCEAQCTVKSWDNHSGLVFIDDLDFESRFFDVLSREAASKALLHGWMLFIELPGDP